MLRVFESVNDCGDVLRVTTCSFFGGDAVVVKLPELQPWILRRSEAASLLRGLALCLGPGE